jgi:hypothetical protein
VPPPLSTATTERGELARSAIGGVGWTARISSIGSDWCIERKPGEELEFAIFPLVEFPTRLGELGGCEDALLIQAFLARHAQSQKAFDLSSTVGKLQGDDREWCPILRKLVQANGLAVTPSLALC